MEAGTKEGALSPRLDEALDTLTARALVAKLREVYLAAARTIEQLGNLNLMKHEPTTIEQGTADLSMWEEMAPAVRDTVMAVNSLLLVMRQHFGAPDVLVTAPSSSDARLELEICSVVDRIAANLTKDIGSVGTNLRRPSVVSDRWNLLVELQEIRSGLRDQVGDLVYLTAAAFADVDRQEVVPGFEREVTRAVLLRATTADLHRAIEGKLHKLKAAKGLGVPKLASSIEGDLESLGTMPAYRHIHAQTKRQLVELREQLRQAAANPALTQQELLAIAEPALALLEGLGEQTRDLLTHHDRAIWAACGAKLEQALLHLSLGSTGAPRVLAEAQAAAEKLYGRDPSFDTFLRRARAEPPSSLEAAQLRERLERFREQLACLPFH